jgi:RNA polymerase sigma-70 factor (ECF subfamily)
MNDKSLTKAMLKLQDGDSSALEIIYNEMAKGVYSFVLPYVKSKEVAEDIMQATSIKVYQKKDLYSEGFSVRNWILTIAKNLALNEIEKSKREISYDFQENPNAISYSETYKETPLLDLAKKILSEDEFNIVNLHIVADMKHKEIASALNMPIGTVTWMYKKAIDKLKEVAKGGI